MNTESFFQGMLMVLALLNLAAALLLLLWPNLLIKMNTKLNRWFSTEKFEKFINKKYEIDKHVIAMKKSFGITSLLFAIVLMYLYINR